MAALETNPCHLPTLPAGWARATGRGGLSMQREYAHPGGMVPSEDEHRSAYRRREQQHTPPTHDRVVIGASAGGIEALLMLFAHLPAGLAPSLFIVQHLPPSKPSQLPPVLRRAARLSVEWATENG